jgi:hypothetical protein
MVEEWRSIPDFDGYEVSSLGRVRSYKYRTPRLLASAAASHGYETANLCREGKARNFTVHTLVAAAFLGARPQGMTINHISGVKSDNRSCNLEYCAPLRNSEHAIALGLTPKGEAHPRSKLSESDVLRIKVRLAAGETAAGISRAFFVSRTAVSLIKRGLTWSHLNHREAAL